MKCVESSFDFLVFSAKLYCIGLLLLKSGSSCIKSGRSFITNKTYDFLFSFILNYIWWNKTETNVWCTTQRKNTPKQYVCYKSKIAMVFWLFTITSIPFWILSTTTHLVIICLELLKSNTSASSLDDVDWES